MLSADPRQNESWTRELTNTFTQTIQSILLLVRSEFHSIEEKGQLLTYWINWQLLRNRVQTTELLHLINKSLKKRGCIFNDIKRKLWLFFLVFLQKQIRKRFIIWHKTSVWMTNKTKLSILKIVCILHITYFTIKLFLCTFIIKCQNISV